MEEQQKTKEIPHVPYSDYLRNIEELPDRSDPEYIDFWLKHIERCKSGVLTGGIFISGWLYWHLNFYKITIDALDEYGNPVMEITNPDFRDNEYMFDYAYRDAEANDKKPIPVVGTRRFAKTVFISSRVAYKSYIFQNSHSVVMGASAPDINNITKYIQEYYEHRPDCFSDLMKFGEWTKTSSDVEISYNKREVIKRGGMNPITPLLMKLGKDNKYTYSRIAVRNLEHGKIATKEELLAGITPTEVIWDEALKEDTYIPTVQGFVKIKDINVGDFVFGKDGRETKVLNKIDVGEKQLYEIELIDGRSIEACGEHLWEVWDNKLKKYEVKTTEKLIKTYINYQIDKRYNKKVKKRRYSIDLCKPVECENKKLELDPYFLGLWLGDGSKNEPAVITQDDEIKDYLKEFAEAEGSNYRLQDYDNNTLNIYLSNGVGKYNPIREKLKKLKLLNNKHIPFDYYWSSINQRKQLLAGLLDSDGTIGKNGHISFSNASREIISGVKTLVCSLGIRYTLRRKRPSFKINNGGRKEGKLSYTLSIYPTFNPFNLNRKRNRFVISNNKKALFYRSKVSIDNITKKGVSQAYCLKVDNKKGLFLADNYVVTHNCGKYLWSKQHAAILPALESKLGKRCVETFVATGGNVDFSTDIERAMIKPEKFNFYHFDLAKFKDTINAGLFFPYEQETDARVGVFVPGEMSLMGGEKDKIPLKDYIKKDYTKKELKELEGFEIEVTNWVQARKNCEEFIEMEYEKSDADGKKAQMYYPFQPEDSFLTTNSNPFPVEEGKKTKKLIEDQNMTGEWVELDQDERGNVLINFSNKKIVKDYPFKGGSHDAPTVIFERPISDNPLHIKYGTYCAGFDGYKINTSETTDSLGSFYIYKRILTLSGFRKQIVAVLATRPTQDSKYYRQCYLLLKMYNAEVLPERDTNFRKFMEGIKAMRYWAQCQNLVKGITPNSKANADDGLPPTPQNKEHILKLVQKYCHEEIVIGYDDEEQPIIIKGIERIPDPMLLEEIIQFGRYKNYDRIIAFGHALAWDEELTRMQVDGGLDEEQKKEIDPDKLIAIFREKRAARSRM